MGELLEDGIFKNGDVIGMPVVEFINWAKASTRADTNFSQQLGSPNNLLALPPVQRTALWTPRQIVDLWDSLFRGLPIGSFFLVKRPGGAGSQVRTLVSSARLLTVTQPGFDLLDGQQRARAMLLGLMGPELEQRCLWVDLGADSESHLIRLHLTSESQPFGYNPENGQKLPLNERRNARIKFDAAIKANFTDEIGKYYLFNRNDSKGENRSLYDYELFDLFFKSSQPGVAPNNLSPWRASKLTYPLHHVLPKWLDNSENGVELLRSMYYSLSEKRDASLDLRIERLDEAFRRLRTAQVALLRVDSTMFGGPVHENMLMLFDRIGAGGTPLTAEERLFSIYKHHEPLVHNLVLRIYEKVGRVLSPTKIVASAIRIANARVHRYPHEGNSIPDVGSFAREISSSNCSSSDVLDERRIRSLRVELDDLLLPTSATGDGKIAGCFYELFSLIRHSEETRHGIPKVMLAELSPKLLQVLLLWALLMKQHGQDAALLSSRDDAIRFVMFWRLCITHEDNACKSCFEFLRSRTDFAAPILPQIYSDLVAKLCAWPIATPNEMDSLGRHDPSPRWLTAEERFKPAENAPVNLYRIWWESRKNFLMWLQREYLARSFDDFDPSSGRDDDMPFELDHICPAADWGRDWRSFRTALQNAGCLADKELDAMRDARYVLGDSIGNFRLVGARINEGDGDSPIAVKMPYVAYDGEATEDDALSMADIALSPEHRSIWLQASGPEKLEKCWNEVRLKAWQQAVEERTLWLYRRFYDDLGFGSWQ